jgi:hypothetical protein
MAASIENLTGVGLVATITNAGTITLPLVSETPNRQLIFKDGYGNLSNLHLTFQTQSPDTFENGQTTRVLNNSFGFVTFYGTEGVWYELGGTSQLQTTISSLTVSSINSFLPGFGSVTVEELLSTTGGLDSKFTTAGYLSTLSLISTTTGLQSNLVSTTGGLIEKPELISTTGGITRGYLTAGYLSTLSLISTTTGLQSNLVSTTGGLIDPSELNSTVRGLSNVVVSQIVAGSNITISPIGGLGAVTINASGGGGSGSVPFISAFTVSTGQITAASINVSSLSSNLWVAVGQDSTAARNIQTSSDGRTWAATTSGTFTSRGLAIAYNGSNRWVAAGQDSASNANLKYSGDGQNWSNTSGAGFSVQANGVAYNGRLWVAVGQDAAANNSIKYSGDGITWSNAASGGFGQSIGRGVAWNGSLWVAMGDEGTQANRVKYSLDGSNWLNTSGSVFAQANSVAWNGYLWVAVGGNSTASIQVSRDGITWSRATSGTFSGSGFGVVWNGRLWVAVGNDSVAANCVKYSYDGLNWSNSLGTSYSSQLARGVAWNGSLWVVIGQGSSGATSIKTSIDGITWSDSAGLGFDGAGFAVAYSYNAVPAYQQVNFQILPQAIPLFLTSTNQMFATQSTLVLNNTLYIDRSFDRVGINTGFPVTDLDVNGTSRAILQSSLQVFTSSIGIGTSTPLAQLEVTGMSSLLRISDYTASRNPALEFVRGNQQFGSDIFTDWRIANQLGNLTFYRKDTFTPSDGNAMVLTDLGRLGISCNAPTVELDVNGTIEGLTLSSFRLNTSSLNVTNATASSLQVNALTIGTGTGWVNIGPLQTVAVSSIQNNTNTLFVNGLANMSTILIGPASGGTDGRKVILYTPNSADTFSGGYTGFETTGFNMTSAVVKPDAQFSWASRFNNTFTEFARLSNQSLFVSSSTVSSITFGTTPGWVRTNLLQGIVFSSIQTNTALGYVSSLLVGTPSTNAFQIPAFNLQLVQNSALKPVNNLWTIGSDLRIKENVTDANLDRCYDDIRSIHLRRFMWREDYFNSVQATDRHVLGFLAQEVSTIVPKAVETKAAYGYPDFQFLNIDQLNMSLYGAVKRTIQDKEILESTVKGHKFEIQTLVGTQTMILSTLNGLQGR